MICSDETGSSFGVARFDPVKLDSVDSLRRLAPACTHPDCALIVVERESSLWCDGITNIGSMGWDTVPALPGISEVGRPIAFRIDVRDPGHMIANNGISYELRAGKIRYLTPYFRVPSVLNFLEQQGKHLDQEYSEREGEDHPQIIGWNTSSRLVQELISRVLKPAIDARHGGVFVILPTEEVGAAAAKTFGIDLKYPAKDLDLRLNILNHYVACAELQRDFPCDLYPRSLLRKCNITLTKMLIDADACGNLSGVDGCVVFNRCLQLCGFSGQILVSEQQAESSSLVLKNFATDEDWGYTDFMKGIGGMRHKSAMRLCKVYPDMLVFIISQDGDLKVFCSDQNVVNAFGPLDLPFD